MANPYKGMVVPITEFPMAQYEWDKLPTEVLVVSRTDRHDNVESYALSDWVDVKKFIRRGFQYEPMRKEELIRD